MGSFVLFFDVRLANFLPEFFWVWDIVYSARHWQSYKSTQAGKEEKENETTTGDHCKYGK